MGRFKDFFREFTMGTLFISVLALLILSQVISLLISSIFSSVPILKTGSLLIILSVGIVLIFIAQIVFKNGFDKNNIIGLLLLGTMVVLMYIYGGKYFPSLFSFIDSTALESAKSLQTTLRLP